VNVASVKNLTDYLNIDKSFFGALSLGLFYLKISFVENIFIFKINIFIIIAIIITILSIILGYCSIKKFKEDYRQYVIFGIMIFVFPAVSFLIKNDILSKINDVLLGISLFYLLSTFFNDVILEKRRSQKLNKISNVKNEILIECSDRVTEIEEELLPKISEELNIEKINEELKKSERIFYKISEELNNWNMINEYTKENLEDLLLELTIKKIEENLEKLKLNLTEVQKIITEIENIFWKKLNDTNNSNIKDIKENIGKMNRNLNEALGNIEIVQKKSSTELYSIKNIVFLIVGVILSIFLIIYYYDKEIKFNRFNEIHEGIYLLFSLLLLNSWINENEKIEE
jgi:membrane protein